ncbi:MAG TPA: PDZ domain-containing protein [Chitinophagales bacterium]|nr:PDZ domain-containing protein [Chitinophagales bacterium]
MRKIFFQIFLICTFNQVQAEIHYEVSFPNLAHHEAQITVTISNLSTAPLIMHMSESSPGRYAIHEFAKNVYSVKAMDNNGAPITIGKSDIDTWEVSTHSSVVIITYTLFGDHTDGTYVSINDSHAHLNMPAAFMWAEGKDTEPISIHLSVPEGRNWKIATQLKETPDKNSFTAPGLQYFMDSPTELSDFTLRTWQMQNTDGTTKTFRIALHHAGGEAEVDSLVRRTKALVIEEMKVYGELANYDYGTYTFIMDAMPGNDFDGMEHRNSTCITIPFAIKGIEGDVTEMMAHEFFHSWNVERIRPKTLEPFDFTRANMSGELWFAEGFTQYYGGLLTKRSGVFDLKEWCNHAGAELNYVVNRPGTYSFSPVEMSQRAPFTDAATAIDPTNFDNIQTTYYFYGSAIALALDLTLREKFKNLTLDDFMQAVWLAYGKTEIPYTIDDLRNKLAEVTGDPEFAKQFFQQYIYGHQLNDYPALLKDAGLQWKKRSESAAWMGWEQLDFKDGMITISSYTQIGDPLYIAGLDKGDVIETIDGKKFSNQKKFNAFLSKHHSGDRLNIVFKRMNVEQTAQVTLQSDPEMELTMIEAKGSFVTSGVQQFRKQWLGEK